MESDRPDDWTSRVTREVAPPPAIEARVREGLRAEGWFGGDAPTGRTGWRVAAGVAAAFVIFAAGWMAGGRWHAPAAGGDNGFMFLLYGARAAPGDEPQRVAEYRDWAVALDRQGTSVSGARLADPEIIVGPLPDGAPSGYFVVAASSMEAARALADGHPHVQHGGTIVVRPIARN